MRIAYLRPKAYRAEKLAMISTANEILADYRSQGYDLTLRQLYYQFVARGLLPNRQAEYDRLGVTISEARLAGLVDWNSIVDRTRATARRPSWDSPADIIESSALGYHRDLWATQPVRVQVWIEKEALAGVVAGVCDELDVPYLSCRGYLSQSQAWRSAMRFVEHITGGQRVLVLHLGDHDPSGLDMTRDIRARLDTFLYHHCDESMLEVRRIALNWDQVQEYQPPPNPAKLSDARAAGYVAEYGSESWELDALPPSAIGALITEHVEGARDAELWDEAEAREEEERLALTAASDNWPTVVEHLRTEGLL